MSARSSAPLIEGRLLVSDLRLTVSAISSLLEAAERDHDALDTFLLTAATSQIVRDKLEDDPGQLQRAASSVGAGGSSIFGRAVPAGAGAAAGAMQRLRRASSARRDLLAIGDELDGALSGLARAVLTATFDVDAARAARAAVDRARGDAHVADVALRLPSCFRSFDQHPRDVAELARRAVRDGALEVNPPVVVGIRTSGSYLAPLLAAALSLEGAGSVPWATLRPDRQPGLTVRQMLQARATAGAVALVIDDPPSTGGAIHRVATALERLGFPATHVWTTIALLDGSQLPGVLARYPAVVLTWPEWDVHRRLAPAAVEPLLERALGAPVRSSQPFTLTADVPSRGHAQLGYHVVTQDDGRARTRSVVAEGAGLGLFGRHAAALSAALDGLVPAVHLFEDGIAVRDWMPDERRESLDSEDKVRAAVAYVVARHLGLPAVHDASVAMAGQQPVWEVASRMLAAPYGTAGLALRTAGLDVAVRHLLTPDAPSVIDGQTGSRSWFRGDDGTLRKVSFAERAFSNLDLACYDAAYDVAGLALGAADAPLGELARRAFEDEVGAPIDEERWLLYRLVHLWDRRRLAQQPVESVELAMSRAWQDWARERLLEGGLEGGATGRVCALDIDGILEVSRLGAPTITPTAARTLHSLRAHGYRPVLATGRSMTELRDRARRYGLDGGVAEYGCAIYDHRSGTVVSLLDDVALRRLSVAREVLASMSGVTVSSTYDHALRAYVTLPDGSRRGLSTIQLDGLLRAAPGLVAHGGIAQTDLVPVGVDKGEGLRHLLSLLGDNDGRVELAVGDAAADLPMLRLARRAFVPAHAKRLAGVGVTATRHDYQRGLADAVGVLLGHAPGHCSQCVQSAISPPGAALIASVLEGLEGGRERGLAALPRILASARRAAHPS